ncbi:MAG TPA: hypothetical protein VGX71_24940 [Pseudaminobacter sp.]|nr:hypothetical protein [Pseudaminobacter sp.]
MSVLMISLESLTTTLSFDQLLAMERVNAETLSASWNLLYWQRECGSLDICA